MDGVDDFLCFPPSSLSALPFLLRREALSLSLSLSLCSTGRLSRTKGGLDLPKSNVEYFRRYLNSASKGGRRKERMRRREGRNRSTRVTNVASLTLILRSNYILSVRRRTEESVVATFPRHRTLPLLPKNLFSFPRFPSSSLSFTFSFIEFFLIKILNRGIKLARNF